MVSFAFRVSFARVQWLSVTQLHPEDLRPLGRRGMAGAEQHQYLDTQPNLVTLGLALVMPAAALLSGASWPQLSRGAEVLLFGCLGVCAQMQWAAPTAVEIVLLVLVTAAAAIGAASWRREPRRGERPSLPATSQPSAERRPQTHEIGVQCRLVGAAGVGGDANAAAAATTTTTATMAATEEEAAGAKAEAEAEVESEAVREREATHELRVLLESDGVLLPPRYDDEELLRFLQTTRPPLLAPAAVGPVADDIRWRAARGGDAGAPRGAGRPGTVASAPPLGAGVLGLCGADRQGRPCLLLRVRHVLPQSVSGGGGRASTSPLSSSSVDAAVADADADADAAGGSPGAAGALLDAPGVLGAPGLVAGVDTPSAADAAGSPGTPGAAAVAAAEVGEAEDARVLALQEALVTLLDQHCDRGGPQALALLLDMRGVELSAAARASPCLNAARDLLQLMRAHYPQRAGTIHVIHLLPVMRWVLAGACALLDSRTAKKVLVHADLASLRQHFAPSALLLEYGGEAASLGGVQSDLEAAEVVEAASWSPPEARPASGLLRRCRGTSGGSAARESTPAGSGSRSLDFGEVRAD